MFTQELINEIPDELTRYIVNRISALGMANTKQHNDIRRELDLELGLPRGTASRKFTSAYKFLLRRMREEKEHQYDPYYDDSSFLSFDNIAQFKNIDPEDLKNAFYEYVDSFTIEEQIEASCRPFSKSAGKNINIFIIMNRINGFSDNFDNCSWRDSEERKKLEYYFLDSVDEIYSSYLGWYDLQPKQYVISKN